MKVSIIVPTFNNIKYLKFFLKSVEKNSKYKHEIILHINDGSDGTLKFAKENHFEAFNYQLYFFKDFIFSR